MAPRGTPSNVIGLLSDEIKLALADPKVVTVLKQLGTEPLIMRSEEFRTFVSREQEKWGALG